MRTRIAVAIASGALVAATASLLVVSHDASPPPASRPAAAHPDPPALAPSSATRFGGSREDCSTRSEANFPGAFTDPRNLVVGPLVLSGGTYTDADTVHQFGGNKFPLVVKAGHVVTVRLARHARSFAGLAYGHLPQGRQTTLRDTHRSVTFVACRPGKAPVRYSPNGPSGSYADGTPITFWSGFILSRRPACIPLEIYVDDERSPRRAGLGLGRRCAH
jgi:hypothetical protein